MTSVETMNKTSNKIAKILALAASTSLIAATGVLAQTPTPKLKVITPSEGQTIYGNKIPVLVSVENFEIVDYQLSPSPAPGQGHIHLWLDDNNPTPQSAVKATSDDYTFPDVTPGEHSLRAELVTNNHQSLKPPQVVTAKFKSEAIGTPTPVATSGFDKNTALIILIVVALVIVAAWWYTKEEDEEEMTETTAVRKLKTAKKSARRKASKRRK